MKTSSLALLGWLALVGTGSGELIHGPETPATAAWFGGDKTFLSQHTFRFNGCAVDYQLYRKDGTANREVWRLGSSIGRFTNSFLTLGIHNGGSLGEPEKSWMGTVAGGVTMGEAVFPVLRKGVRTGTVSLKMAQLSSEPTWIFFRIRGGEGVSLDSYALAARCQQNPHLAQAGSMPSRLFLAWPDGSCASGVLPPWIHQKPAFDALAFFMREPGETAASDFLVFDPENVTSIGFQRWDSVAMMVFRVVKTADPVFALGCNRNEASEEVAVPAFMKSGRQTIRETMKTIAWELSPTVDRSRFDKLLAEAAALLQEFPDPELEKTLVRLRENVRSLVADDVSGAAKLTDEVQRLSAEIATRALAAQMK